MRIRGLLLLAIPLTVAAQSQVPTINPNGIVRGDTTREGILSPGVVISIWGHNYGPHDGCKGPATEVCRVQVLLDGVPIEVQYTNDVLVNARMPGTAPPPPVSHLVVVSGGLLSDPVEVRRGPETAVIALDGEARVDGSVWIHVELPRLLGASYPSMARPWDFACDAFEVRKDGKTVAPIAHPSLGMMYSGPSCPGSVRLGDPNLASRLPLHLQYDLRAPGAYEIRLLHYGDFGRRADDVRVESAWTPISVLPAAARKAIAGRPQEPMAVLRDFLPNLLAHRDDDALAVLLEYLYHPSPRVRSYAADALYYWPDAVVEARLLETVRASGPSPAVMQRLSAHAAEAMEAAMPYFFSDDLVLFQGAIAAARAVVAEQDHLDPQLLLRVEERLTAAANGNLWHGDGQTVNDLITVLAQIHTERVHDLLWTLADRHTNPEQTLIAIAWQKNPKDLQRMAAYLIAEPAGNKGDQVLTGVPYSMRNSFGDAARPWLRSILEKAPDTSLRVHSAQELMRANDGAGFTFAIDAISNNRAWKNQIRGIVAEQFPDMRTASDTDVAKFLSARVP